MGDGGRMSVPHPAFPGLERVRQSRLKSSEIESLLTDYKKSKSSSHCEASEIITEGNQELGFASGAQQSCHILGSVVSTRKPRESVGYLADFPSQTGVSFFVFN
jgi:hypothetical protein